MGAKTLIEWADASWPVMTGCDHVSPGCDHCYAARLTSGRLKRHPAYAGLAVAGRFTGEVRCHQDRLSWPFRWRAPQRIFVADMGDLFHPGVPDGFIAQVWDVMGRCPQHTFMVLTKRHARMRSWMRRWADTGGDRIANLAQNCLPPMPRGPEAVRSAYTSGRSRLFADMLDSMGEPPEGCAYPLYDWMEGQRWWPRELPNVWLGVSVEDQKRADLRIPALLGTPAAVRFLSCEPLLGPVDLRSHLNGWCPEHDFPGGFCVQRDHPGVQHLGWVIAGGESGPGARPMHPAWARQLRDQCQAAGVAFFYKQAGEWAPDADNPAEGNGKRLRYSQIYLRPDGNVAEFGDGRGPGQLLVRVGKKAAGRVLDGRTWDEYPPTTTAASASLAAAVQAPAGLPVPGPAGPQTPGAAVQTASAAPGTSLPGEPP